MQSSPPLEEPLGRLIALARRANKQLVWSRVSDRGLTPQQFWTMLALRRLGECSLGEVARRVAFDDPTASRVIATLVRRRLVSVGSNPDDRRRSRLRLSASGTALLHELEPIEAEVRARTEGILTPAERQSLVEMLRRITASLEEALQASAPSPRSRRSSSLVK